MLLAKASIGRKLLLAFMAMALLVLTSALIGVFGFSSVAKTERNVVNSAIPSMIEARQVSELSSRIISSVQVLSNAKTEQQRQESGKVLFSQLESLLASIKQLGSDSFDTTVLTKLESDVQVVIDTLAQFGLVVEKRLMLVDDLSRRTSEMRSYASELERLTRTQVANTSTVAVANVTHIYDLLEEQNIDETYQALDALVEVDLDLAERLHELHLLAFKMLNHIEEVRTISDATRIQTIQQEFNNNLEVMKRRVKAVEDPTRSVQMTQLLLKLEKGAEVFDVSLERYRNELSAKQLMEDTLTQFTALNTTVSRLVDESNVVTTHAVEELKTTLQYAQWTLTIITLLGLVIVVFIVWKVVYVSVLKRLAEYSSALMSIAQGQLKVEVTVQGNDELAHMGQSIITARDTAQALKVAAESEVKAKRELEQHKEHLEELVTERTHQLQQANERLNEEVINHAVARKEAEQASRAKSAFLATMSHEIRTPMNGVLGTARLLKDAGLNAKQSFYVDVINRSGKTLLAILNDVLDYSKIEAGHLEVRPVNFSLHAMVDDVKQLLDGKATEKNLELSVAIESDLDHFWYGDVTRISQVLNNLVGNAIKFTDTGYVDIYVASDPEREGCVLFEVSDSGIGISEQEQQSLFDAFTQAAGGFNSKGGTGLGLAISKKLVEAMEGELEVESSLGEGSRFWFSIPLELGEQVEESDIVTTGAFRAKVLLVEDNPVNSMVAEGFLHSMGHEVEIAENGETAKALFANGEYDIALLDINLPDTDGVSLLADLRVMESEQNRRYATPIVAVSAHVFNEEVEKYLQAGFDGYLPKPLDKDELSVVIQNCLDGHSLLLPQIDISDAQNPDDSTFIDTRVVEADTEVLGKEKMLKIADLFDVGSTEILNQLESAAKNNDAHEVTQLAHKLKGSAGSLGLLALFELCKRIEKDNDSINCYLETRAQLVELVKKSKQALKALLA